MSYEEIILTIGNMELKITNEGNIQVRAKKGTAVIESGFKAQHGKETTELTSAFTTTSTSWVDVTGLNLDEKQKTLLQKIRSLIVDNRGDLYKIAGVIIQLLKS